MYDMEPDLAKNPADPAVADALDRLRRGAVEPCVLTLLASAPAYAHDIVRALSAIPGLVTSEGTVYPMLSRMRRAGLVQTHWQESPSGPPRRYYALTDEGSLAVAAFARAWPTFRHAVDTIVRTPPGAAPADSASRPPATTNPTTTQEPR